jgi:hypothetical protein
MYPNVGLSAQNLCFLKSLGKIVVDEKVFRLLTLTFRTLINQNNFVCAKYGIQTNFFRLSGLLQAECNDTCTPG